MFGIGTTSPTDKLHVNSPSGTNAFRAQVNGSTKFIVHSNGNVGIGTTSPSYKLHVVGSTSAGTGTYTTGYDYGLQSYSTATYGYGIYANSNYLGIYGYGGSYGTYGSSGYIGAYGYGTSYGTYGYSSSGSGAYGSSYDGNGVYGYSSSGYGGNFESYDSWGLRASTTNGYYAGVFYGHVYASDGFLTSDKNLKTNIHDFADAMSIINRLKPQNYEFKKDAKYTFLHLPKGSHYGLLAQDVEQVLPNLVSEAPHEVRNIKPLAIKPTADGKPAPAIVEQKEAKESINIKAVNYVELIPILVKAMQEQDLKIQEQQQQNEDLKKEIAELKSQVRTITKHGGSITTNTTAFLKQNTPNPSDNNTVISYYTPNDTKNAQITVTDINGSLIKTYTLPKGEGQVTLRRGELASGTYNYTLYVNNSKIDTKQMIVIK